MTITILAAVFLLLVIIIAVAGQRLLTRKTESVLEANREQCSICRKMFDKSSLVERQVGDFKMMYFCKTCIESLSNDLRTNQSSSLLSAVNTKIS